MSATFDGVALGDRIKLLRALRRMSLDEVGQAAGLTKSHVWELERGRSRNPTVNAVWGLARALSVSPAAILGLDDTMPPLHPLALQIAGMVDRAVRGSAPNPTPSPKEPTMAEARTRDREQEPPLEHPKTPRQALLRALAEAAMSVTHHDAGDHEPGFIHEVRSMERKFAGLLRGKLKPRWAGRAALTQPETPDHG